METPEPGAHAEQLAFWWLLRIAAKINHRPKLKKSRGVICCLMPKMPSKPKQPKSQADDFASVARRLGCDEDKATFEAKLKQTAKAKPGPKGKGS